MTCFIPNLGMMGYGQFHNIVKEIATPLWARAMVLKDDQNVMIFVHLEQCFVTMAIKEGVLQKLKMLFPEWNLNESHLMITAQHTHSAPGGYSHYPFYNFTTGGFQTRVFDKVVSSAVEAIEDAAKKMTEALLEFGEFEISPDKEVAFNRSMTAYLNNSNAKNLSLEEKNLAVDRKIRGLKITKPDGTLLGMMNWFGVHNTSISSFNQRIHHDNKGVAAALFEQHNPGSIAFFLQGAAGDISPNFIWDKKTKLMRGKFTDHYENAAFNGEIQFRESEKISYSKNITGKLKSFHTFFDMTTAAAPAAHGVSFFTGTLEGPGLPRALGSVLKVICGMVNSVKLLRHPEDAWFYQEHGNKTIMLDHRDGSLVGIPRGLWKKLPPLPDKTVEAIRKTAVAGGLETLPWIPPILPFQIMKIGNLLIVAVPGEISYVSSLRLKENIVERLKGSDIEEVVITSYANAYMGYITTPEEYSEQCYEGGHTVYGRRTLEAIMEGFNLLISVMTDGNIKIPEVKPFQFPKAELDRRSV